MSIYIKQVLIGLEFLHSQGVVHRDIKGANILTTKDSKVKVMLNIEACRLWGCDPLDRRREGLVLCGNALLDGSRVDRNERQYIELLRHLVFRVYSNRTPHRYFFNIKASLLIMTCTNIQRFLELYRTNTLPCPRTFQPIVKIF